MCSIIIYLLTRLYEASPPLTVSKPLCAVQNGDAEERSRPSVNGDVLSEFRRLATSVSSTLTDVSGFVSERINGAESVTNREADAGK